MVELMNGRTTRDLASAGPAEESSELELMQLALNQVDYGMVVLDADSCEVRCANALGRDVLEGVPDEAGNMRYDTALCMVHRRVTAHRAADAEQLRQALARTRGGLRGLLSLGIGRHSCSVAVVPLSTPRPKLGGSAPRPARVADEPACHALLVFAKQQLCDESTMALFARERGLTSAEGQVLAQVCRGMRPNDIARHHGVRISTVRTQLRNIRVKTCSDTISEVVQKVSVLPPMARYMSAHNAARQQLRN